MSDPHRQNEIARMNRAQSRGTGGGTALIVFLLGVLLIVGGLIWAGARNPDITAKNQQTTTGAASGKTGADAAR